MWLTACIDRLLTNQLVGQHYLNGSVVCTTLARACAASREGLIFGCAVTPSMQAVGYLNSLGMKRVTWAKEIVS